jgi:hypothetical protein
MNPHANFSSGRGARIRQINEFKMFQAAGLA